MIQDDENKSLLRCTIKKSVTVSRKVLKYGSCIGACLFIIGVIGGWLWSVKDYVYDRFTELSELCSDMIVAIPWYLWVIISVPVIIIGYSYAWCISREFRRSDWESGTATCSVFICLIAALGMIICSSIIIHVEYFTIISFGIGIFIITTLSPVVFLFDIADADKDRFGNFYYLYRFPGAYLHYKKRSENIYI